MLTLLETVLFIDFSFSPPAGCLIPEGGQNMIPTTETLLKNDFPEGSEATLECANGYVKDSGSGILTCLSGKWTEPDLTCISELYLISRKQTVAPWRGHTVDIHHERFEFCTDV